MWTFSKVEPVVTGHTAGGRKFEFLTTWKAICCAVIVVLRIVSIQQFVLANASSWFYMSFSKHCLNHSAIMPTCVVYHVRFVVCLVWQPSGSKTADDVTWSRLDHIQLRPAIFIDSAPIHRETILWLRRSNHGHRGYDTGDMARAT